MQYTIIALGVALAAALTSWWARRRRVNPKGLEARCRRDIKALRRTCQSRAVDHNVADVWSAGADPERAQSRTKKSVANLAIGTVSVSCGGGCGGGCGGCGCGCGG